MPFQRVVNRALPDGSIRKVYPFHISLEGMESVLICRDDEDYDHLQKSYYLAAWKHNSLIASEISMSNHGHFALLSTDMGRAQLVGEAVKKRHSQFLSWKYNEKGVLSRSLINVQHLDTDWYVRNALAYIHRNTLDAGSRVEDYKWSSYRAMFVGGKCSRTAMPVSAFSRREREAIFHTHEDLSKVPWLIDIDMHIEPASACDFTYLEEAFGHDQAFFLKTLGAVNMAEMEQKLVVNGRSKQTDMSMQSIISNLADKWFGTDISRLTPEQKARLIPYLFRSYKTSDAQLARCLGMGRELVAGLLNASVVRRRSER